MIENKYNKKIIEIEPLDSADAITGAREEIVSSGYTEECIVTDREHLRKFIEEPCLAACLYLYDRNIRTVDSSANKNDINGRAYIGIDYDSLSDENKKVVENLIEQGIVERKELGNEGRRGERYIMISTLITESSTVGQVNDWFMKAVSSFQMQDLLYGRYSQQEIKQELESTWGMKISIEDIEQIALDMGYAYDEDEKVFWENKELLKKHLQYQKGLGQKERKDNVSQK